MDIANSTKVCLGKSHKFRSISHNSLLDPWYRPSPKSAAKLDDEDAINFATFRHQEILANVFITETYLTTNPLSPFTQLSDKNNPKKQNTLDDHLRVRFSQRQRVKRVIALPSKVSQIVKTAAKSIGPKSLSKNFKFFWLRGLLYIYRVRIMNFQCLNSKPNTNLTKANQPKILPSVYPSSTISDFVTQFIDT
jgi:hypothetical protein